MAFRFRVAVGSAHGTQVIGGFSDVTGLAAESDVESLRDGGVNSAETMLPGATKFPARLVLKRGLGDPARLWRWYLKIMSGAIAREDVTVTLVSADRRNELSWTFSQACPVKWTGPELHAGTSAVAFETVELIHKGFLLPPG
jgi:phage tail-like protein